MTASTNVPLRLSPLRTGSVAPKQHQFNDNPSMEALGAGLTGGEALTVADCTS